MERAIQSLLVGIMGFFLEGWMMMLFIGGLHHEVFDGINTVGYWKACLLAVPIDIMVVSFFAVTANRIDEMHKRIVG